MNARIATLRLSLMLVSRVCLGINAFDGKGRKTWQAFQQLGSGMLNFPVSPPPPPLFFLPLFFMALSSIHCKMLSTDKHA